MFSDGRDTYIFHTKTGEIYIKKIKNGEIFFVKLPPGVNEKSPPDPKPAPKSPKNPENDHSERKNILKKAQDFLKNSLNFEDS